MRLRTLLTLTFGIIALALALVSSWVVRGIVTDRVRDRIGDEMTGIASQIRDGLDRGMFERLRDIEVAASLDTMRDPSATIDAKRRVLKRLQDTYPAYAIITLVNAAGKIVATSNGLIEGADVSKRGYFLEGRVAPFAADVHEAILLAKLLGSSDGDPLRFVDLAAPIVGDDGTTLGVLAAHLDWAWAREIEQSLMEPLRRRITGLDVLILSADGTVLLGPRAMLQTKLDPALASVRNSLERRSGFEFEQWSDGETYVTGFSPTRGFRTYKGLGWTVLVRQKADIALAGAVRLGREIMIGGMASALVFALIAFWAAQHITKPLLALSRAADRLREGDEPNRIPVSRSYFEVDHLSQSLKALVERLDQRRIAEAKAERERAFAESANQAKSEFLASMSHEIRTPLTGILGFAGLLLERDDLATDVRHRLVLIQTAGQALLTVVNDILDYSKIEAGEMILRSDPFQPATLIDNALSLVRSHAEKKGIEMRFSSDPALPAYLVGDDGRLRQVLLNLLNNAIKFTSRGHVELSVRCEDGEEPAGLDYELATVRLRFEVKDTGIGIPPDKLDRLFVRFSQVDSSISRTYGGTGLGLAISKRFVEMMGGEIGVVSEDGKGSTFWFTVTLPVGTGTLAEETVFEEAHARSDRPGFILLADDLPMNREIVEIMLHAAGHRLHMVENGEEAIRAIAEHDYDLMLMDVQMPVLDGVSATRLIRAMPDMADLPIIALTANVLPDQIAMFEAAGMNDHVGKPFSRLALLETVERWLGRRQAARERAVAASSVFDAATHDDLLSLSGPGKMREWLSELHQRLADGCLSADFSGRPIDVRLAEVHKLVSQAGMLGFTHLSEASAAFEAASGGEPAAVALAEAARQTLPHLDRLIEAASDAPAVRDAA